MALSSQSRGNHASFIIDQIYRRQHVPIMKCFINACLLLVLVPIMMAISWVLDSIEDCCPLSGHSWGLDGGVHMLPKRQCSKCGQVQVKLPELDGVSEGGWVNH